VYRKNIPITSNNNEQLHFFCFFLSFFCKLFAIFWRFYLDTAGLKIGYRTSPSPSPSPKPDPNPSPKLLAACWSENRTIVRNLTWTQQSQAQRRPDRLRLPWLTAPEYRTIVTSYAYLDAVKGVSLATLVKN